MKIALLAVPVVLLGFIAFRVVDGATIVVETCDDLVSAVEATAVEDTTANCVGEHFVFLSCGIENDEGEEEARTLTIKHHTLTIEAPDLRLAFGEIQFDNVRFELVSSGELVVTRTASFTVDTDIAVAESGGWLYVEEGSKARFLEKLEVRSYVIQSILDSGEFASETLFGGCLFNQGYVRVEGHATFSKCGNSGIGESPPGDGGAIFNGESGSILFAGGVFIEETSITDGEGACGAGIYNLGKVNIKGNSVFSELFADTEKGGGAIYNAEGAKFTFRNKASAAFSFNRAGSGSAVYNEGEFTFSGPALFYLNWNAVIENRAPGSMKLSSESSFWLGDTDDDLGAVSSFLGATLGFPDDLQFVSLEGPTTDCDHIYLETEEGLECHS